MAVVRPRSNYPEGLLIFIELKPQGIYLDTLPRGTQFKVSDYAGLDVDHAPLYNAQVLPLQAKYWPCPLQVGVDCTHTSTTHLSIY